MYFNSMGAINGEQDYIYTHIYTHALYIYILCSLIETTIHNICVYVIFFACLFVVIVYTRATGQMVKWTDRQTAGETRDASV